MYLQSAHVLLALVVIDDPLFFFGPLIMVSRYIPKMAVVNYYLQNPT